MSAGDRVELAATTLRPPTLPRRLVARPRVAARLDAAIEASHRFLLVSAPAGSGKSTAVAAWLDERPEPAAWLQVEAGDADPARFWTHLVAAIDQVIPGTAQSIQPKVASTGGDADALVPTLVNALTTIDQPLIVVVDDHHLIDNPQVHAGLERLVELCPDHVTLVLVTRSDPPFRLGRLRVRQQITEIRAADLRFDAREAGELLDTVDATLATRMCERTEGWAAGLVLAGISLASSPDPGAFIERFGGNDTLVVDYLTDELLGTLEPDQRQRLLETSVLERLNGPLVDAVCGTTDGATWLHQLAAQNQLVVSLDHTATWFRYHHLLRDVLRLEAERTMAERLPALHLAAARWHHRHGDLVTAIDHYIDAGELETAADLIGEHATQLLNGGQIFTVLHLLDRLGDLPERNSRGALVRGWTDLVTGRLASAERWFDIARRHDDGAGEGIITALGIMIRIAQGDIAGGVALAEATVAPTESTQAVALGAVWAWAGRHDRARPFLDLAAELAASEPSDFAASVGGAFDALSCLETGATLAAEKQAAEAVDHAATSGVAETPQLALAHAVLAATAHDAELGAQSAKRAVDLARRSSDRTLSAYVLATAGDVLAGAGDAAGEALLREARTLVDQAADPGIATTTLSRVESRHGLASPPDPHPSAVEDLTERELAVLRHLPTRRSQREIAEALYVSLNTVKTHCRAIYRKLGVNDRKTAVQRARELDLL